VDAHGGDRVGGLDQPLLDGEGADAGQHVAAVGGDVDLRLVQLHLREQIVDIDAGPARPLDDGDLAGQRIGAAEAVDLAPVGRAHGRQQHPVAQGPVARQVGGEEIGTLGGAATHQDTGNTGLHRLVRPPYPAIRIDGRRASPTPVS